LFLLVVGEFLVTIPAARLVLGDDPVKFFSLEIDPILPVSLSIAVLSVVSAHLFGLTLKSRTYHPRPQPPGTIFGFGIFAALLIVTVLFLSAIRSDNVRSENTLLLGDSSFGTILFFVLQLSFIAAATGLAFYNHSEIDAQIGSLKKEMKRAEQQIKALYKRKSKISSQLVTTNRLAVQMANLNQKILRLASRYEYLANIYVNTNMMSQPKVRVSAGKGLEVPPIPAELLEPIWNVKVDKIENVIMSAEEFHSERGDEGDPNGR
jgi:hypothetical protein